MDEIEQEVESPTVTDVIVNLLQPSTLPHVILIGVAGFVLYMISATDSDTMFALGIAGFIGLSLGYALTAWMQEMSVIYRFSHFQPLPEHTTFVEKILCLVLESALEGLGHVTDENLHTGLIGHRIGVDAENRIVSC